MLWKSSDPSPRLVETFDDPQTAAAAIDGAIALKVRIHQRLIKLLNLSLLEKTPRDSLRLEIRGAVSQLLAEEKRLLTSVQTDQLVEDVLDELLGLGPLEPLLKDDTVSDILINTHAHVYVERKGRLEKTDVQFQDTKHLVRIVNKIVSAVGRCIDEFLSRWSMRVLPTEAGSTPSSRPWRSMGRWFRSESSPRIPIHMSALVELGSISGEMAEVMKAIVEARRNVLHFRRHGSRARPRS